MGKSRLLVEVLAERVSDARVEWVALDRREAGYRGWRRLLGPLWLTLRRTELPPAELLAHLETLDDILLVGAGSGLTGRRSQERSLRPSLRCWIMWPPASLWC